MTFQTNSKVLQSFLVSLFFLSVSLIAVSPSPLSPPSPTKEKKAKAQMRGPYPGPYSLFEGIYGISF